MQDLIEKAKELHVIDKKHYQRLLAYNGNFEKIKEIYLKYGKLKHDIVESIALGGHLEILKWLKERHQNMSDVMSSASATNNITILEWGIQNGLKLTKMCLAKSIHHNAIEAMEWLINNKCSWDYTCYVAASDSRNIYRLEWLLDNNCPCDDWSKLGCHFANTGNLAAVKWLYSKDKDMSQVMYGAVAGNIYNIKILEWGLENRLVISAECARVAKNKRNMKAVNWFKKHYVENSTPLIEGANALLIISTSG